MVHFFNTNHSHSQPRLTTGSKPRKKKKKKKKKKKRKKNCQKEKMW